MFINFWYCAALSEAVTDSPLRVPMLGQDFVLFRDSAGAVNCLNDVCAHRGASLSHGMLKGDLIQCPYHGWRYDGSGACQHIPTLPEPSRIPARARVDSYPTIEQHGLIFAFLGDLPEEDRPPLYNIEEYGSAGWKTQLYVFEIACNYERSMENGLDPIHNEFVHPLQGAPMMSPEQQRKPTPVEDIPWGSKFYMPFPKKAESTTKLDAVKSGDRVGAAGSWHQGPNQLITWIDISAENAFHQYGFEAPIDDSNTRIFFVNMRSWLLEDKHDMTIEKPTLEIVEEDVNILQTLRPIRTPPTNTKEILVPGDHVVVRYREWLAEWDANGWRIDYKKLKEQQGDVAFAIPCPGRRESGNWVLDPIPMQPGGEQARKRRQPQKFDAA